MTSASGGLPLHRAVEPREGGGQILHARGFQAAIREGIERATKTLRNVQSAWVKDRNVLTEVGQIRAYKVNLLVTFVLEDSAHSDDAVPRTTGQDAPLTSGQEPTQ